MRTLVVLFLVAVTGTEALERCAWAKKLKDSGMDGYAGISLANWVCLTRWESNYKPGAIKHNSDGTTNYGIFQVSSRWWCTDGKTQSENGCHTDCSALLNNVDLSIACAKRIITDPSGITAWRGWVDRCQSRDLTIYLAECNL